MKSMKEYYEMKSKFFNQHKGLENVETSPMDEYSVYHKEYFCGDGTILHEVNGPYWMNVETVYNLNGTMIHTGKYESVKFFRTEVYSSVNANSEYFYEVWH